MPLPKMEEVLAWEVMIYWAAWRHTAKQASAPLMEGLAQQQPHGGR